MGAANKAYTIIRGKLELGLWKPGERLPSGVELARMCTVSLSTLWRAIELLRAESLVHSVRGASIIAGPKDSIRADLTATSLVWQRVATKLGQDLLANSFGGNLLPLITKLALHYGVTVHTLRKALHQLELDGLIIPHGRGYRIAPVQSTTTRSIALVSAGNADGPQFESDPRTKTLIECYERECNSRSINGITIGFEAGNPSGLIAAQKAIGALHNPIGYIVNMWDPGIGSGKQRWLDLITYLLNRNLPVVAIDQDGDLAFPPEFLKSRNFRVLRITGARSGEIVGKALMSYGHKQIAYITPFYTAGWVQKRYQGLCHFCTMYGIPAEALELYALQEIRDNFLIWAILGLDKEQLIKVYSNQLTVQERAALEIEYDQMLHNKIMDQMPLDEIVSTIRYQARALASMADQPHDRALHAKLFEYTLHLASDNAISIYLQPFFKKIIAHSKASVWVCSDHRTAITALAFLRSAGKKVPQDIAVVGFENWPDAQSQGLTTYDFNMPGFIQESLRIILDGKYLKSKAPVSEVDGYVVERRTTRKQ